MTTLELHIAEEEWSGLRAHLFPGDHDEHGAVLLCGIARSGRSTRLLARDVSLAQDGVDYVPGIRGYRHLSGEFVTHQVRRAKDLGLAYLAVHNHGGTTSVDFSGPDMESHERHYPTLRDLARQPVGGLVMASQAVAGDLWMPDGTRATLDRTVIVGAGRTVLTSTPSRTRPEMEARYGRQALVFGEAGQGILRDAKVAIIGAGGVGMLLVQACSRLGVGHLVVVDPERVDPTNLPRLPEATRLDAMELLDRDGVPTALRRLARRMARHKVAVATRIARRASPSIRVESIVGDIADDDVARRVTDCDFIILAADSMLARSVVNQIAYQYLIPTLQVGSKVVLDVANGDVLDVFSVVRTLGTVAGCLSCNGLIDFSRLADESLGDPVQLANQRYVDDPDVHVPSVITLNAMGAGWAANDFMHFMVGLDRPGEGFRILRTSPRPASGPHVVIQEADQNPDCPVCSHSDHSSARRGDGTELATRTGRRTKRKG